MTRRCLHNHFTRWTALATLLLIGAISTASADKVTLEPSNWGKEEGEACIDCHRKSSAGLLAQWEQSAHAEAKVNCFDCHQADPSDDDAIEHEGSIISTIVSPKDCARCHETEFRQQQGSVHASTLSLIARKMPALGENLGGGAVLAAGCAGCHGSRVEVRGDGTLSPDSWPTRVSVVSIPTDPGDPAPPAMAGMALARPRPGSPLPARIATPAPTLPIARSISPPSTA